MGKETFVYYWKEKLINLMNKHDGRDKRYDSC